MTDLIFVSLEPWDDIWRRNQFVCAALAKRHPTMRILFVIPARDVSNRLRRWSFADAQDFMPESANITVTRPLKIVPNSLPMCRKLNEALFRQHVRRATVMMRLNNPLLWLNPHYAGHMVGRMGESAVIYDITDDWTTLTQSQREIELIKWQDAKLCRQADATIVCSQRLYDMKRGLSANLHLVPNGVDADHYAGVFDASRTIPAEARAWPKPVLGYTGTIHPDRVDVKLVAALAKSHRGSVALIGPNHLPEAQLELLQRLGNVFMPGPVPYAEIPNYMASFDVCITPHKMTPFTESLNPIKLWEYLAAGLPIVSTDVAGFRDYPDLVRLARTPDEFIAATKLALLEGTRDAHRRQAEARRHSWERRVDQIESVMVECVQRRCAATTVTEVADVV